MTRMCVKKVSRTFNFHWLRIFECRFFVSLYWYSCHSLMPISSAILYVQLIVEICFAGMCFGSSSIFTKYGTKCSQKAEEMWTTNCVPNARTLTIDEKLMKSRKWIGSKLDGRVGAGIHLTCLAINKAIRFSDHVFLAEICAIHEAINWLETNRQSVRQPYGHWTRVTLRQDQSSLTAYILNR